MHLVFIHNSQRGKRREEKNDFKPLDDLLTPRIYPGNWMTYDHLLNMCRYFTISAVIEYIQRPLRKKYPMLQRRMLH